MNTASGVYLTLQQRNVAARPDIGMPSTAAHLYGRSLAGGAAAAGFDHWGLAVGARADLLVLNQRAPGLLGVPGTHWLDALVFATEAPAFSQVWVAGRRVVAGGVHGAAAAAEDSFQAAMQALWA